MTSIIRGLEEMRLETYTTFFSFLVLLYQHNRAPAAESSQPAIDHALPPRGCVVELLCRLSRQAPPLREPPGNSTRALSAALADQPIWRMWCRGKEDEITSTSRPDSSGCQGHPCPVHGSLLRWTVGLFSSAQSSPGQSTLSVVVVCCHHHIVN
jgi:hypothetical protein